MIDRNKRRIKIFSVFIIMIAGILAYSNSFDCSFHFDDERVLESSIGMYNSKISDAISILPNRPLALLTFAINYRFHGFDVYGYHFVNLVIHLANAVLIWWLTLITLATPAMKNEPISSSRRAIAFFTGLLFVTHPLATQSVTYISQRFTLLATLFYLLSLILFIKGRLWSGNRSGVHIFFAFSLLSAVCGIFAKEIVFTLPFAVLLYDYFFIKDDPWKLEVKGKTVIFSVIVLLIFVIYFFKCFSLNIFDTVPPGNGYSNSISMKEYFLTQFRVILTYIRIFIRPVNQNLDYDYPVSTGFFQIQTFLSFLALLGILSTGIALFKRYRLISFGIFWFFLTLSVESSIIPISQDVIYEHRTYLPGFGFFLVLTTVFYYFIRGRRLEIALFLLLFIAVINTALTYQRNKVWKDDYTLWGDCVQKSPDKARVNNNFGAALSHVRKNPKEAVYYHNRSIELNNKYAEPYDGRGFAHHMLGLYHLAVEDYNEAIRLRPDMATLYNNRGFNRLALGQYGLALDDYNEAIRLKPDYAEAYNNRGFLYYTLGRHGLALDDYNEAIRLRPDYADYYNNRGNTYGETGDFNLALEDFDRAIRLKPEYDQAYYCNRGIVYFKQGNKELGCLDMKKACESGNCRTLEAARSNGDCLHSHY